MIDSLMEWSRNIVCFSIFAVLIKNLLPGEKYTPYVRLYIGFMMILVFFTPLLRLLEMDATLQYLTEILGGTLERKEDSFLASIYENSNYERQKEKYTKLLEDSVTSYLTEWMEGETKWQGYRVERARVSWEEEESGLGNLTGITVYLKRANGNEDRLRLKENELETDEERIWIAPVLIEAGSRLEEGREEESGQLRQLLAQFYRLREEDVTVRITE